MRGFTSLIVPGTDGSPVFIQGRVCDDTGVPVSDAVIDVWQGQMHSSVRVQRDGSFLIEAGQTAPCVVVEIRRRSA